MNMILAIIACVGLTAVFVSLYRIGRGRRGYGVTLPLLAGWCLILAAIAARADHHGAVMSAALALGAVAAIAYITARLMRRIIRQRRRS